MEETKEQIKKHYILHFVLKPEFNAADDLHNYAQTINAGIEALEGQIEASLCQEGTRRLAYQIGKQQQGHFCESAFLIAPEKIKKLSDNLKGQAMIMRYMIESKQPIKRNALLRMRRLRTRPAQTSPIEHTREGASQEKEKRSKVSMDEIDKKLDEIIKNI